jgi:hypothetical protein
MPTRRIAKKVTSSSYINDINDGEPARSARVKGVWWRSPHVREHR